MPHHLIDVAFPDEDYHAGRFVREAELAIAAIRGRGRLPLLVGGTGLYVKSLLEGIFELPAVDPRIRDDIRRRLEESGPEALHQRLAMIDPVMAARIHPHDSHRIARGMEIFESSGVRWSDLLRRQERDNADKTLLSSRFDQGEDHSLPADKPPVPPHVAKRTH